MTIETRKTSTGDIFRVTPESASFVRDVLTDALDETSNPSEKRFIGWLRSSTQHSADAALTAD